MPILHAPADLYFIYSELVSVISSRLKIWTDLPAEEASVKISFATSVDRQRRLVSAVGRSC